MQTRNGHLSVYEVGPRMLVGFVGGCDIDSAAVPIYQHDLSQQIREHECQTITFDLTDVPTISSETIAFLFSFHRMGVEVQLYRPSAAILDLLSATRLNSIIKEVESLHSS